MDTLYEIQVKEVGNPSILHPTLQGEEKTREELIEFFGLDHPDVEWFKIFRVEDGETEEM